jgi:predicted nucleotidyltransferase/biotin operon repressor
MQLLDRPLALFFDAARSRVLDVLLTADAPLSGREIAKHAGLSPTTANAKVVELEDAGLVTTVVDGRAHRTSVRHDHPLVRELRHFARAQDADVAQLVVDAAGTEPVSIVLFGSTSRGESGANSDVDLLLVAVDLEEARQLRRLAHAIVKSVRTVIPRRVEIVVATAEQLRARGGQGFAANIESEGRVLRGVPIEHLLRG